jgi:hypothetical protein
LAISSDERGEPQRAEWTLFHGSRKNPHVRQTAGSPIFCRAKIGGARGEPLAIQRLSGKLLATQRNMLANRQAARTLQFYSHL